MNEDIIIKTAEWWVNRTKDLLRQCESAKTKKEINRLLPELKGAQKRLMYEKRIMDELI